LSQGSFESLVQQYGRLVLNTALRVLGDVNLANDVHQEVFLAIWRRWASYNGQVNWTAYLYRATVRKALEAVERRPRTLGGEERPEPSSQREGPGQALAAKELRQGLAAALARLPDRQTEAFVLIRLEGLDASQAAALLGCSQDTVRVHLHRAIKRLTWELREYLG
jgi:RNA polymerase sigma-70 factor (ECF subfamily)